MSNTRTTRPRAATSRATTPRARQARPKGPVVTFMGAEYRIADEVGVWPLMQFARSAESGASVRDARGLAAVHAMLEDVIHPDDWGQFQEDMISKKANDLQAMFDVAQQAVAILLERQEKNGSSRTKATIAGQVEA